MVWGKNPAVEQPLDLLDPGMMEVVKYASVDTRPVVDGHSCTSHMTFHLESNQIIQRMPHQGCAKGHRRDPLTLWLMQRRLGYGQVSKCLRRNSFFPSVTQRVSRIMSNLVILPAPNIETGNAPGSPWERERRAFHQLLPSLQVTHPGHYVAVHEGKVIASGRDRVEVAMEAYERVGYVSLFVGMVAEALPRRRVRVPSPRVRRGSMPV